MWPNGDGFPLTLCCESSTTCVYAFCACEQKELAEKGAFSFLPACWLAFPPNTLSSLYFMHLSTFSNASRSDSKAVGSPNRSQRVLCVCEGEFSKKKNLTFFASSLSSHASRTCQHQYIQAAFGVRQCVKLVSEAVGSPSTPCRVRSCRVKSTTSWSR